MPNTERTKQSKNIQIQISDQITKHKFKKNQVLAVHFKESLVIESPRLQVLTLLL